MTLGAYISIGSAVTAFVSATLCVIAARARVSYDPKPNEDGCYLSGISDGDDDFMEIVKKQAEWSRQAAYSAAIAAVLQGISVLLHFLESS